MAEYQKNKLMTYFEERKRVVYFGILVMLITIIPYLVGFSSQGSDWRYTGFVIGVEDGNSYIAKMLSGADGDWLFRSPYSVEDQKGVIAFLPYLLLGKLSSEPAQHDQLVVLYHAFRLLSGFLVILASHDFIGLFITKKKFQWWTLFLVVLGGGLGWVLVFSNQKGFFGSLPLDFISPESFGFLGILGFPHLCVARALLLWGLVYYLNRSTGYLAGLFWLVMGLFQPLVTVIVWAIISIHLGLIILINKFGADKNRNFPIETQKLYLKKAAQAVLVSSPIVIYTAVVFLSDAYLIGWNKQNILPSPHFLHYIIAYGIFFPFTILGLRKLFEVQPVKGLLLIGWVTILPILIYAPIATQRRLVEGIWVVIVIGFLGFFQNRTEFPVYAKLLSLLALPTTLLLVTGSITSVLNPAKPLFIPVGDVAAYQALASRADKNAVVLSSFETGNNLPAWVPVQVVMGHGPETINLYQIKSEVDDFFNSNPQHSECRDFFKENNIEYLFWGPSEANTWSWDPDTSGCLTKIYNQDNYSLYQVEN